NRMVGIVTFDDAMDVLEEETSEDMALMSGMLPSERTYLKSSVWSLFRNRIPWLLLLMISATFTGMIITSFETALAAQAALIAFIPMLMGTGGNSGAQSSVTIIRGLSMGEITPKDVGRILWKELRVSLLCGVALAAVTFLKMISIDRLIMGSDMTPIVALTVSLALFATVVCAKLIGCLLPLVAQQCKLDPAVMASPMITTVVDAVSLLLYFSLAKLILGI
ncbi:MAG: magnesium transporter, partial [Clostridia bacterium]|nr:magnesium transporter [Clostridia bacterium]